ncbi:MAG: efflux RND transporter periplasmic adaptor subunit [Flavobacteriales bacterium]
MSSCKNEHSEKEEEVKFTVTLPQTKDTLVYKEYVGQVRGIQHIELRAFDEGYLQNIFVDEGQRVKKGQVLFQLTTSIYNAEMLTAKAEADFAEIELKNTKALADKNVVSPNELALAQAKFNKAKAELALAEAKLQFTEIKAPFDGIVGRFGDIRLGSLVEEGELLTTLSDNSKLWVYFNVPEAIYLDYMQKMKSVGDMPRVKLKMANNEFYDLEGDVETIEADFNNETGNIAFRATFSNPNSLLRHGQTGKIYMPIPLKNSLLIPQKAVFEVLDKKYVYVVKDGKLESHHIEVGNEMEHIYEVTKGLSAQDTLLVDGLRKVRNGQEIEINFVDQEAIIKELRAIHAE